MNASRKDLHLDLDPNWFLDLHPDLDPHWLLDPSHTSKGGGRGARRACSGRSLR